MQQQGMQSSMAMQTNTGGNQIQASMIRAAEMQESAANAQFATGGVTTGMAALQMGLAMKHFHNSSNLDKASMQVLDKTVEGQNATGRLIVGKYGLRNSPTQAAGVFDEIKNDGSREQKQVAQEAMMSGVQALAMGSQQLMSAEFARQAAQRQRNAAAMYAASNSASGGGGLSIPSFNPNANVTNTGGFSPPSITPGNTSGPTTAAAESASTPTDNPGGSGDLGSGFGTNPLPNSVTDPQAAGGFNPQQDDGGGGAGGGTGFSGGGSTDPAYADSSGPGGPSMAPSEEGPGYLNGNNSGGGGAAGASTVAGAGGPGSGGGGGLGFDPTSFLGKLLGGKDEAGPSNGIMDFGKRGDGADQPNPLYGREKDIFEGVHKKYGEMQTKNLVGLR
jgi:hypothetical protein